MVEALKPTDARPPQTLASILANCATIEEMESKIPPEIANQLSKQGSQELLAMLIKLTHFGKSSFDRDLFNNIVAFDYEKNQPLSPKASQNMINIALSTGILNKVTSEKGERYTFHADLHDKMDTLVKATGS